ncbi:NifU family protein [Phenylobacterium sp.]|uniref:NifU family protein n=1 Tax=Phenylobacterium sp. TaxID=1871053 RepID=UPI003BAC9286
MFITTEPTPNPDAMKFSPPADAGGGAGLQALEGALTVALRALPGVGGVFVAPGFVTVTRAQGRPWGRLGPEVIAALSAVLDQEVRAAPQAATPAGGPATSGDTDLEAEIRGVLDRHVRPGVARDGGDIEFDRFDAEAGVLWIHMRGACGGCPSARLTLKGGVQRIVQYYVPEVAGVEEVEAEPSAAVSVGERLKAWAARLDGRSGPPARTAFSHQGRPIAPERV